MPVYNVEKYLRQCVDSIIGQTYPNIRIILVDDGSTDSSGQICDEYASLDPQITVIHKSNGGPSDTRNVGLHATDTKYIYFLDSDDYIEPQAIEILHSISEQNNLDVAMFDSEIFFEEGCTYSFPQDQYIRKGTYAGVMTGQELLCEFIRNGDYRVGAPFHFYNREFLSDNNITFYKGIIHEDNLFTFAVMLHAQRAMHIPLTLYNRRYRASSIMTTKFTQRNSDGMYTVLREALDTYGHFRDDPETKPAYDLGICDIAGIYASFYAQALNVQNNRGREQFREIMYRLKLLGYDTSRWERIAYPTRVDKIKSALKKIPGLRSCVRLVKKLILNFRR